MFDGFMTKVSWRSTFSVRFFTEYFFIQCHLQPPIAYWYLPFPRISLLRNTQVWINLTLKVETSNQTRKRNTEIFWKKVCSCVNEEKCQATEICWARGRSFWRGKVRQKWENRGKASRLHGKVQEVSLKER